jgi:4-diphosphocytidyl-2-C-methyl-D-erythritol kinase
MTSIELTAPAKVNLFLKVLGKRKDSYHNLLTLFERIDLCDTIKISKAPEGITVTSDRPITGDPRDNIAYKATELILSHAKARGGASIRIRKRIPMAAGLGGGSSDAAAVLIGLNKIYNLNISRLNLMRLGAKLGADVPFFLFDAPFATGRFRGDKLRKAAIKLRPWHLLVYPGPFKASTREVYAAFDGVDFALTRHKGNVRMTLPKDWIGLESLLHNDLGDVVAKTRPVIGRIKQCLVASLSSKVIVSGSGPSLFCLYRTRKEALEAKRKLFRSVPAGKRKGWQVFIVGTKA